MGEGSLSALPRWAADLLAAERVARLGFLDDHDRPRVLPVTFALHDDAAWTAVDHKPKRRAGRETARVRYLLRRPQAALTVDRYDDDWGRLAWVQLLGRVEVVEAPAAPAALEALRRRYRQYAERAPEGPLLRLEVERALSWRLP